MHGFIYLLFLGFVYVLFLDITLKPGNFHIFYLIFIVLCNTLGSRFHWKSKTNNFSFGHAINKLGSMPAPYPLSFQPEIKNEREYLQHIKVKDGVKLFLVWFHKN